jgi:hypothetical protein
MKVNDWAVTLAPFRPSSNVKPTSGLDRRSGIPWSSHVFPSIPKCGLTWVQVYSSQFSLEMSIWYKSLRYPSPDQIVVRWVPPGWEWSERRFSVARSGWLGWVRNRQGENHAPSCISRALTHSTEVKCISLDELPPLEELVFLAPAHSHHL